MNSPSHRVITRSGCSGYANHVPSASTKCSPSYRTRGSVSFAASSLQTSPQFNTQSADPDLRCFRTLPPQITHAIMRYASGVAALDPYINLSGFSQQETIIPRMASLVRKISITPTQIFSNLRYELIPQIHQYAVYCGERMRFLGRPEYRSYACCIIIVIPQNIKSFRSVVRAMYWLPKRMREQVSWVGLSMGSKSTISVSEYGALSGAFPKLKKMFVELGRIDATPRRIAPAIIDGNSHASITALTIIDPNPKCFADTAMLVHRNSARLEYLHLQNMSLEQLGDVFWPETRQQKHANSYSQRQIGISFSRLKRLFINFAYSADFSNPQTPTFCQFPMLEELNYEPVREFSHVKCPLARSKSFCIIQTFFDSLLQHRLPRLKDLRAGPLYNIDCIREGYYTPALTHLSLVVCDRSGNNPNARNCTPSVISGVFKIKTLMALDCHAISHYNPKILPQPYMSYVNLEVLYSLNLKHWPLRISFFSVIVNQIRRLRRLQITLLPPRSHQPPEPRDSRKILHLKYVWINSATTDGWNTQSLDYLVACIVDMCALEKLQLFSKALLRLRKLIALKYSVDDMLDFALRVKVGNCSIQNQDGISSSIMEFN